MLPLLRGHKCLPLCTRWSYIVTSASYNSIYSGKKTKEKDIMANQSWSQIRIFFPSSAYRSHKEEVVDLVYVAACGVRGIMNLYMGISSISFLEVGFYGIFACCAINRMRRRIMKVDVIP